MNPPVAQRCLAVVNPSATDADRLRTALTAGSERRNLDLRVAVTPDLQRLDAEVRSAVDGGTTVFLAVGGDGTAHQLINRLPIDADAGLVDGHRSPRRMALAMLPAGTGSDFARTFGQRNDVEAALDRLVTLDRYPIDLGWVEGSFGRRWFLNAANAGIAAQSVITAERVTQRIGALRYTAAFWLTLPRFPSASIDVTIDRHRFTGDALNVVIANGQFFGGGLNVAPRATLVDGVFDVLVFSGARSNAFTVMPRLAVGSHLTHRAVRRYVGADVHIEVPERWPIEADGELLGHGPVRVGIVPSALDYLA